jgi:metallo-beta-lactamase family protein
MQIALIVPKCNSLQIAESNGDTFWALVKFRFSLFASAMGLFENEHQGNRLHFCKSGAKSVRIFSQEVPIRAQIAALEQFSDHADTAELLYWLKTFKTAPATTYLVHGEPQASSKLQQAIFSALGWNVKVAHWLEKIQLE